MKMFLNMAHYYPDGYKNDYSSCIDTPIAVSAGCYHYENYFYYLFYHAAAHNWSNIPLDDWQAFKGGIVRKLGLELIPLQIDDDADLIPLVKEKLNRSIPVMMPTKYKALFYFYLSGDANASHFILISGYDSKRRLIQIRDANHLYESGIWNYVGEPSGLFPLFINEDMLLDIWVKSNQHFARETGPRVKEFFCFDTVFHHKLYSLEKTVETQIHNLQDLMKHFLETFAFRENRLAAVIEGYNGMMDVIGNNPIGFEIAYRKSFFIILGVIGRWLAAFPKEPGVRGYIDTLAGLKSRYMERKTQWVSGFIADAKARKNYPDDQLKQIAASIRSQDEEIFTLVASAMDSLEWPGS